MGIIHALLWAVLCGVIAAVLGAIRAKNWGTGAATAGILAFLLVWITDWAVIVRPVTTWTGLLPVILADIALIAIACWIADFAAGGISAGTFVPFVLAAIFGVVWIAGYNSGHGDAVPCPDTSAGVHHVCSRAAYGIVPVDEHPAGTLPASTTTNLVIVTGDEAATKASQAMSSGEASTRNFSSYLNLGPATLQRIDGTMYYAFPLEFDGHINKTRLGSVEPGYILINAQDPNAAPVERYDGAYSMVVSLGGGQGSEPDRWAYDHGYSGYLLDDGTLEIPDRGVPGVTAGAPYWTVTLLAPQVGKTFYAPAGVLLIDAHTGAIHRYSLPGRGLSNATPGWVDRVYGQDMAEKIVNWYGFYSHAPFGGKGNSNRYQVSGDPVLVYTGDENPSWRMLETSYGNEKSAYRIIEMNSATGAIGVYQPAAPMGIEAAVATAFCNAQGTGAGNVRANHLVPEAMALHLIDGQLVWMASYESSQQADTTSDQEQGDNPDPCPGSNPQEVPVDNPTFAGIGFVPAYAVTQSNAVYGATRAQALQNLLTSLASQQGANGNTPGAGATQVTVSGTLCQKDVDPGAQATYYLTLCGAGGKPDYSRVYTGTSAVGPAIVLARAGDPVVMKVLKVTASNSQQQVQGFSDARHPIGANS